MSNSYPTYRTSGLDWLGQIPSHWECVKTAEGDEVEKLAQRIEAD